MPLFNTNAYNLKSVQGFDPLFGKEPSPTELFNNANRGRPFPQRPLQSNPLGNALAGLPARGATRVRGGAFAPRAVSGMS